MYIVLYIHMTILVVNVGNALMLITYGMKKGWKR
jgi:hypothetical protein